MAKFCAWCGKPLNDEDVFCAYCGKRADGSDAPSAAPAPPVTQQPQPTPPVRQSPSQPPQQSAQQPVWQQQPPQQPPQQPAWQQPQQPAWQQQPQQQPPRPQAAPPAPPKRGGSKGVIIGVVALVLVLAVGVGGFVWPGFFKKDKDAGASVIPKTEATEAPAATKAPKATKAPDLPKETEAPKPVATPEPTPAPTPEHKPKPTPAPTEPPYVNPFTDVKESDWFYAAVQWAGKNGVISGTEFKPNDLATRAQAITFLWRAAGQPTPNLKVSPYTDVKESDYFHAPVLWGFENGLISTAKDAQFHPNDTLTRATALTFISRAVDGEAEGTQRSFADVPEGKWYFDVANWALENGVVGRDDNWSFYPDETATRAQFITFMYRAMEPTAKKANPTPPGKQSFEALGISADYDNFGPKTFNTITSEGEKVTFTAEVTDYRVFEQDDAYPLNEGYEWRVMTVHISTMNDPERARTYLLSSIQNDIYNVALYEDSAEVVDDVDVHTIIYNGVPTESTIWMRYDYENKDGYLHVDYTWTASVPKGYDGQVVGFRNREITVDPDQYINEYFTSTADFALFRMK